MVGVEAHHVGCVETFWSPSQFEFNNFTLLQGLESLLLDLAVMDEDVLFSSLSDEAKTFGIVEPFHRTRCHTNTLLLGLLETNEDDSSQTGVQQQPQDLRLPPGRPAVRDERWGNPSLDFDLPQNQLADSIMMTLVEASS